MTKSGAGESRQGWRPSRPRLPGAGSLAGSQASFPAPNRSAQDRPQLAALTGLRIIAALWVVIQHFRFPIFGLLPATEHIAPLLDDGYLGVEVFFILSGFIISYQYAERLCDLNGRAYLTYLRLRFARIYPVHLVTLFSVGLLLLGARAGGVALSGEGHHSAFTFASNLAVLQAIPPGAPWNGPAWSITMEGLAYLAFPVLAFAIVRVRSAPLAVLLATTFLALTMAGMYLLSGDEWSPTGLPQKFLRIGGEFTAGCFLWVAWRKARSSVAWDAAAAGSFVCSAALLLALPSKSPTNFVVLPLIALIVVACALANGPMARFFASAPLQWGGRISYSMYMTLFLVQIVLRKALPWERFDDQPVAIRAGLVAIHFLCVFITAAVVYNFVEEPARKKLRPWASRLPGDVNTGAPTRL